jgi:hypothetical protein
MTIGVFIQTAIAPVPQICDMGGAAVVFGLCISHLGCSEQSVIVWAFVSTPQELNEFLSVYRVKGDYK